MHLKIVQLDCLEAPARTTPLHICIILLPPPDEVEMVAFLNGHKAQIMRQRSPGSKFEDQDGVGSEEADDAKCLVLGVWRRFFVWCLIVCCCLGTRQLVLQALDVERL